VINRFPDFVLKDDTYDLNELQTAYMMCHHATLVAMQAEAGSGDAVETVLGGIALIYEFTNGDGAHLPDLASSTAESALKKRKVEPNPPHLEQAVRRACH
jgi:hypothetical protein